MIPAMIGRCTIRPPVMFPVHHNFKYVPGNGRTGIPGSEPIQKLENEVNANSMDAFVMAKMQIE